MRPDFEILIDEVTSLTGLLRPRVADDGIKKDLIVLIDNLYHCSTALREENTFNEQDILEREVKVEGLRKRGELTSHSSFCNKGLFRNQWLIFYVLNVKKLFVCCTAICF